MQRVPAAVDNLSKRETVPQRPYRAAKKTHNRAFYQKKGRNPKMTKAADIMTQDVVTIKASATVAQAVKLMKLKGLHSLIVERRDENDAYGIVTDTDIAKKVVAYGKDSKTVYVSEVMTKPCIIVNPDLTVEYVARLFDLAGIDRAPVIQGSLLGIISVTDILQKGDFLENPRIPLLEKALQTAISNARSVGATKGTTAVETTEAWEQVNELEAELAFCRGQRPEKTAFEQYGDPATAELATV
jgi:CBS domain-containing protein